MSSATTIETSQGRQYHIDLKRGEVAPNIILVGDPNRARKVASRFDEVTVERSHREYSTLTGTHEGLPVTVMGTGMGPGNTEIAIVELCQTIDDPVMIRCGSTGALQPGIGLGELCITMGAYRLESTSTFFVDEGYPSVAHPEVVMAIAQACAEAGLAHHIGITATAPGFYGAQGREVPGFPVRDPSIPDRLARQGVQNLEMEASTLLTLATLRGFRAGAVCAVYANRPDDVFIDEKARPKAESNCIDVGLASLHRLADMDRARGDGPIWHPGLAR